VGVTRGGSSQQSGDPDAQLALEESVETGAATEQESAGASNPISPDDTFAQIDARIDALRSLRRAADRTQKALSAAADSDLESLEQAEAALSLTLADHSLAALVPLATQLAGDAKARLVSLKSERSDVRRRREDFARLAHARRWRIAHTGEMDHVGPFTLHHSPDATTISYGSLRLARLKYPSPTVIGKTVEAHEQKLNADAHHDFSEFLGAAAREQEKVSQTEAVPWPAIVEALISNPVERKRMRRVLLWRLGLLLSGGAPGGWRIETTPPNLQEMPRAWSVPRLDRPNDALRLFRIRLIRDPDAKNRESNQADLHGEDRTRQSSDM
jgi:hypothetical protein